jgi:FMN phosphatase YigB (HAD superfamily)
MIKAIIFDIYGVVIDRKMRFSERFSKEFDVPMEKIIPFFENEFQLCLVGKADLKEEVKKYLKNWGWEKSVEELLKYWFSQEKNINQDMLLLVDKLRKSGIKCFLSTDNEKYITKFVLKDLELEKRFDQYFISNEIGFQKFQKEFWEYVILKTGSIKKEYILCLDDKQKNIDTARSLGFQAELYLGFDWFKKVAEPLIK